MTNPQPEPVKIRTIHPKITTFTTPFNRFAPFNHRKYVAVGNRATAISLPPNAKSPSQSPQILLLNPIALTPQIHEKLNDLGGVHYIAADLGHHMYVAQYTAVWPEAKTIGVRGLERKRADVKWAFLYGGDEEMGERPEDCFDWGGEVQSVLFEGFITRCVAWFHVESRTLVVSDLLMSLPATEQYNPSSASQGPASYVFSKHANPHSPWFKRLIYHIASLDYVLMRQDAKEVLEWDFQRIIPCHGDFIESSDGGGYEAKEAWKSLYEWVLEGPPRPGKWRAWVQQPFMTGMQWLFLL